MPAGSMSAGSMFAGEMSDAKCSSTKCPSDKSVVANSERNQPCIFALIHQTAVCLCQSISKVFYFIFHGQFNEGQLFVQLANSKKNYKHVRMFNFLARELVLSEMVS